MYYLFNNVDEEDIIRLIRNIPEENLGMECFQYQKVI